MHTPTLSLASALPIRQTLGPVSSPLGTPCAGGVLVDLVGIENQKGGSMKVFKGMYPRLALVALIVSLALASGAAKKWC